MSHRKWSYFKSSVRILAFLLLVTAEVLGILEERDQ